METNEIYKAPEAELETDRCAAPEFFVVKPSKLFILGLLSFGLYYVFVSYKNWSNLKYRHELNIWPVPRAIFSFVFIMSFVTYLGNARDSKGLPATINLTVLATVYVLYYVASILVSAGLGFSGSILPPSVQFAFSALGLLLQIFIFQRLQSVINLVMDDVEGEANARFGGGAIALIIFGILVWLGNVLGVLFPAPAPI